MGCLLGRPPGPFVPGKVCSIWLHSRLRDPLFCYIITPTCKNKQAQSKLSQVYLTGWIWDMSTAADVQCKHQTEEDRVRIIANLYATDTNTFLFQSSASSLSRDIFGCDSNQKIVMFKKYGHDSGKTFKWITVLLCESDSFLLSAERKRHVGQGVCPGLGIKTTSGNGFY